MHAAEFSFHLFPVNKKMVVIKRNAGPDKESINFLLKAS